MLIRAVTVLHQQFEVCGSESRSFAIPNPSMDIKFWTVLDCDHLGTVGLSLVVGGLECCFLSSSSIRVPKGAYRVLILVPEPNFNAFLPNCTSLCYHSSVAASRYCAKPRMIVVLAVYDQVIFNFCANE